MRALSESSLLDLLVFKPLSMTFIFLSALSLMVPLFMQYLKNRQLRASGQLAARARFVFTPRNAFRFDFIVVAVLTLAGAFFVYESLKLSGNAMVFHLVVFAGLAGLGLLICVTELFEPAPETDAAVPLRTYRHIALYMGISLVVYALIPVLGFCSSMLLCMLTMLGFATFYEQKSPLAAHNLLKVAGVSGAVVGIQYACFSWLLHVSTPTGVFV